MDVRIKSIFIFVFILVNTEECMSAEDPNKGHFRCTWHHGKSASGNGALQITDAKQTSCSVDDSLRLSSYVNYCTKQNYVPWLSCKVTGEWNCESFIAMCKTMVRNDPLPVDMSSRTTMVSRKIISGTQPDQKPRTNDPTEPSMKEFSANENYFTMKEMAVAVLVSFITGASVLAIVIFVVWRWRNCHVDSENKREEKMGSMKHIVSLEAIAHLAHALGFGHDKPSHNSFVNPNYGQLVTTRDILEEVMEQDRVYEDICTRRKSSCNHADCIYATVDKKRPQQTIIRTKSGSELKTIDENCESDIGYEADNNATPQTPRRVLKYLANAVYSVPRSPHINDARVTFGEVDAEMLRNSLNHLRQFHPITDVEKPKDNPDDGKEPEKVLFSFGALPPTTNHFVDCNKSDSGYVDDLPEITIEEVKTDSKPEKSELSNVNEPNDTPSRL